MFGHKSTKREKYLALISERLFVLLKMNLFKIDSISKLIKELV
jgi:hypothetical protein